MKMIKVLLLAVLLPFWGSGCNDNKVTVHKNQKPIATEVLKLDPQADIFQWENNIYKTGIEWVNELEIEEKKQIGAIKFNVTHAAEFKNNAANQLPIGSKIYSVKDRNDILIVKYENEVKRYLVQSEG